MKKIYVICALLLALCLSACSSGGITLNTIKGDWTIYSVNGVEVEKYAESLGDSLESHMINMTVNEDSTVTMTNSFSVQALNFNLKANGFEILNDAGLITMAVVYENETLTYMVRAGEDTMTYTFKRGLFDFDAAENAAA